MFGITLETEGKVGAVKLVKALSNSLLTIPMWLYCCGSLVPVFGVRVSVMFHPFFVYISFIRFGKLSGHLLGKSC